MISFYYDNLITRFPSEDVDDDDDDESVDSVVSVGLTGATSSIDDSLVVGVEFGVECNCSSMS